MIRDILGSKARRYEYLKHVTKYPNIINYLTNDDKLDCERIPSQYLEPFIQNHVNGANHTLYFSISFFLFQVEKNPTAQIYDQITQQLEDIRRSYLRRS